MNARHVAFAVLAVGSVAWVAAILVASTTFRDRDHPNRWRAAAAIYGIGAVVCHQRAERSFHTAGVQWPVCARCTGLYAGAASGVILWAIARRRRARATSSAEPTGAHVRRLRLFTLAIAAPTLITVVTGALSFFDPSNAWRAALALPLGAWTGGVLSAVVLGDLR